MEIKEILKQGSLKIFSYTAVQKVQFLNFLMLMHKQNISEYVF